LPEGHQQAKIIQAEAKIQTGALGQRPRGCANATPPDAASLLSAAAFVINTLCEGLLDHPTLSCRRSATGLSRGEKASRAGRPHFLIAYRECARPAPDALTP
jgi:hypothetical protein